MPAARWASLSLLIAERLGLRNGYRRYGDLQPLVPQQTGRGCTAVKRNLVTMATPWRHQFPASYKNSLRCSHFVAIKKQKNPGKPCIFKAFRNSKTLIRLFPLAAVKSISKLFLYREFNSSWFYLIQIILRIRIICIK